MYYPISKITFFFPFLSSLQRDGAKVATCTGFVGPQCIQPDIVCDGYSDCKGGEDERLCQSKRYRHYCIAIPAHDSIQIACPSPRIIQIDDAWFDNERYCFRTSQRQSKHSDSFQFCNNRRRCIPKVTGWESAKMIYHCKASKTVTGDTISTLKNINIPTHVMHINKTFMKNDSKIDKRKQKSQGRQEREKMNDRRKQLEVKRQEEIDRVNEEKRKLHEKLDEKMFALFEGYQMGCLFGSKCDRADATIGNRGKIWHYDIPSDVVFVCCRRGKIMSLEGRRCICN
ncbi:unnamed protein product [Mytilus edulis]|uniref:Uncharacterized protein n=1 Tax=Mytilus edulis TaxID=6550 RepID=A0A8S3VF45_MYTED|nr:unnamed protein product [Mytilus edulis]